MTEEGFCRRLYRCPTRAAESAPTFFSTLHQTGRQNRTTFRGIPRPSGSRGRCAATCVVGAPEGATYVSRQAIPPSPLSL
jgi:hypothetical protein